MLVEISNGNILNSNIQLQKLFEQRFTPKKHTDFSQFKLSTKKLESDSYLNKFSYLPNNIKPQLVLQKLAKQSLKSFRFTNGKNKQAEKRLDLEIAIIEKEYAYDDSNWLRDYTSIKQSVKEVETCSPSYDELLSQSQLIEANSPHRPVTSYSFKSTNYSGSDYLGKTPSSKYDTKLSSANSKESNFVIQNMRSYTSMVSFKYDRSREQLDNFNFKKVTPSRLTTASSCNLDSRMIHYEIEDDEEIKDTNGETNNLNSNKMEEILSANKSVRRSLKSRASARDINNKIKYLENKCNYCREQNTINFRLDDRNVRYGDPPPKNKKFKQLKILSQLESIIK